MRFAAVAALATVLAFSITAAPASDCTLCVGVVADTTALQGKAAVPAYLQTSIDQLAAVGSALDTLTPEQKAKMSVVVAYAIDPASDPLMQVEANTKTIVDWAKQHGPFAALGVVPAVGNDGLAGYALKRLAVLAQGVEAAATITTAPPTLKTLGRWFDEGATPYVDSIVVDGSIVRDAAAWLAERDPSKHVIAVVQATSPNPVFDAAQALADGATLAFLPPATDVSTAAAVNTALAGDYAFDSTNRPSFLDARGAEMQMPALAFVRGSDLRTLIVPKGDAATFILAADDQSTAPRRFDAQGERAITDAATRGSRLLAGIAPALTGYAITLDRVEKVSPGLTKEAIDVATQRGITVEEIIRNHQAYRAYQKTIEPRYIAKNMTKLRFAIGETSETIEATIAGPFYSTPDGAADWAWDEFLINGVRWKYGKIPELPLVQPEKVTQLPLDIQLTNDYRYQLVRETTVNGYPAYEVRFEPLPNAPAELPLYRGTVWIDKKSWSRVRISMVQLNLTGEVLSNEERVEFTPFLRSSNAAIAPAQALATDPRELLWLATEVWAQQVVSAAGRANVVQRETTLSAIRLDPPDFEAELERTSASDVRMVRDTDHGLRYLEKRGDERVVQEGFKTSRLFLLGGLYHDEGLDYPVVPLGGINYFDFNLKGTGIQTNVFFAGVVVSATASKPDFAGTRANVGADFFGLAVPYTNSMFRNGAEQPLEDVKAVPLSITGRVGHPFAQFGKIDLAVNALHLTYQRAEDTAPDFTVPSDTFVISPSLSASYSRWGYTIAGNYDYSTRTKWEPWGYANNGEYDPEQKNFTRYAASFAKSFFLPKFQRVGIDVNFIGGDRLDRFSKYELGYFGPQRVRGIESGTVRAEQATIAHLSYGFVFSDMFRMEALYDHAWVTDKSAGLSREPFQGIGIAGQTVGPFGTLLRIDLGTTIGRNRQDGFVANVVFLKLF